MKNKRLSYFWLTGLFHAMMWVIIIMMVFVLILWQYAVIVDKLDVPFSQVFQRFLFLKGLWIFLGLVFGLRPILILRSVPKVLYSNGKSFSLNKKLIFNVDQIERVVIKQVGIAISHIHYYELVLNLDNKQTTVLIVEKLNKLNFIKQNLVVINTFEKHGLAKRKVKFGEYSLSNKFGFRDKTKSETFANKK